MEHLEEVDELWQHRLSLKNRVDGRAYAMSLKNDFAFIKTDEYLIEQDLDFGVIDNEVWGLIDISNFKKLSLIEDFYIVDCETKKEYPIQWRLR